MNTTLRHAALCTAAAGWLAACSPGPSEGELVAACLEGSHPQLVNEGMCRCFARAALRDMPPQLQRAMMLEMQGNKREAAAIVEQLSFEERAEIAMQQLASLGQCAGED